ncbi:hypothetical protein FPSE_10309 [Fusarium pseudograminearum CS3096]|uniref:Uncharacterized protein n=1 Tax=Fusarium pseudograminearum (strain CS3096) TaxID=1028729 RepID=K3V895_FUSPC|nr:hypothetical protein FPSE_10309 [Fusarium pseudograminearum CS3096]EKJ69484.1 hypothetical protein FPSE_10309 [Fusarium pseudograminearum CS3096]
MHVHYLPVRIRALKILASNGDVLKVALGIVISNMIKIEIQHALYRLDYVVEAKKTQVFASVELSIWYTSR